MALRSSFALLALLLAAAAGAAAPTSKDDSPVLEGIDGGSITDGVNLWRVTGASPDLGVFTDFEVPIGLDHQFATWWWYRVAGDTSETILPLPDTENYDGALATFAWADVDGRGLFSAELNVFLVAGPGGALLSSLDVANISGAPLALDLFAYNDLDIDGSAAQDSAAEVSPSRMDVFESALAGFIGNQADDYQVAAFPGVRDLLNDDDIDDFNSLGLPFGPGDFTGGYQWSRGIPAGDGATFATLVCVDAANQCPSFFVLFEDNFETGDTAVWDATVP